MKGLSKRITAQAVAFAMTFQMVGQLGLPIESVKVYAENEPIREEQPAEPVNDEAETVQPEEKTAENTSDDEPAEEKPQYEDMTVSGDMSLGAMTEVNNLYINYGTLDLCGNTLKVHGDVIINERGSLNFNKGELICENFSISGTYYSHYMYMRNPNDKLTVNGNFDFTGGTFSGNNACAGTIDVRGNVNITRGFNPTGDSRFILSGLEKQTLSIYGPNCCFNTLEIANTGEEGVVCSTPINSNSTIGSLGQLHFSFGGTEGTALIGDSDTVEIDGDYSLAVGTLDLNGKTFIVNGNFIQSGGEVKLNGGHLIVKGDYRIQTNNGDEGFSYSTGILNMTNASEIVEVSGDFVMQSIKNHDGKLTDGTLIVGGSFSQLNAGSGSAYNFKTSGNHTTVFNKNENVHTISFADPSSEKSHFTNLTFGKDSEISVSGRAVVTGVLDGTDCTASGYVTITGSGSVKGKYSGDLRIGEEYTLNSNIDTAGNLLIDNTLRLSTYEIKADGNITQNSYVYCNSGTIRCEGDYNVNSSLSLESGKVITKGDLSAADRWHSCIHMKNGEGELNIGGNFSLNCYYNCDLSAGKIIIKGDCNISSSSFKSGAGLDIVLDGDEKQTLSITDSNARISRITITNTSDEGIEITRAFNYDSIINESGAKLFFADGGVIATGEPQKDKTKTIDGDFVLAMGELDLNGNTLIVNGDLIQEGGSILLNGGHLIVKGDYRVQSRNGENYTYSTGMLNMTNESDIVEVSGDFVMQSTKSHAGKLTDGTLMIGGNFKQINAGADSAHNFRTSEKHKTVFTANESGHTVSFADPSSGNSHFTDLTFENGSSITTSGTVTVTGVLDGTGCTVNGYVTIAGSGSVKGKYSGDLRIGEEYTLNSNIDTAGNLLINNTLRLSTYEIKVDGNIIQNSYVYCNSGTIRCEGGYSVNSSLSLESGKVITKGDLSAADRWHSCIHMKNGEGELNIGGNFSLNCYYNCDLTAGKIIIKGDCNISSSSFRSGADLDIILSGNNKQTLNVTDSGAKLSLITIRNTSDEGIEITRAFNYDNIKNETNAKLFFSDGGIVASGEPQAEKTKTINGDLILAMGDLDLNGNTLIINGDFIHAGGTVTLNGGHLIVKGDYRVQTKNGDSYTYSTGILNMTNESDIVEVSGDFVMQSNNSHDGKLTKGTLIVGGNFYQQSAGANSAYNFRTSGDHTVVFKANEDGHRISFDNPSSRDSHFTNLIFEEGSAITPTSTTTVTGVLTGKDCTVNGYVTIAGSGSVCGKYSGNLRIGEEYTLNSNIDIAGDLLVANTLSLNSYELNADGNVTQNAYLYCNSGTLHCKGDYSVNDPLNVGSGKVIAEGNMSVSDWWHSRIILNNADGEINVGNNFSFSCYYNSDLSAGKLRIHGDCNISSNTFKSGSDLDIILDGDEKQTLNVSDSNAKLSHMTIENTSEEGIEITTVFNYDSISNNSNAKIFFKDGGTVATGEPQREKTKTIDGDLTLAMGELDLNGNTLIINGDLIQFGGTVRLNGGHLIVNGNYRLQTKNGDDGYTYGTGILNMTNGSDIVEVSGDFVMQSTQSHEGKLTAGTLIIGGGFSQMSAGSSSNKNFKTSGEHTTVIKGKKKQFVSFENPNESCFTNVTFENSSGISLNSVVKAYGKIKDTYRTLSGGSLVITALSQIDGDGISGNVNLTASSENAHLTKNLTFNDLTCNNLYLDSGRLSADSVSVSNCLDICNGTLEVKKNLYLDTYAYFYMKEADAKVVVGGNFKTASRYTSDTLTNGTLEIKGDFIHSTDTRFVCSGEHCTILSGKSASNGRAYVQTVSMFRPGSKFNKLIIRRPQSLFDVRYYGSGAKAEFTDICNEFVEEFFDIEAPSKVTGVSASELSASQIHLVWNPSEDNVGVTGYEIYRNGEKLLTTGRTEFIDQSLVPDTAYTYQIYAFDKERNYSAGSEKLTVHTTLDTEAPETPNNIKFSAVTGSALTISWNPSKDNVKTAGYIIYRDNEEIARTYDREYRDAVPSKNKTYSYMIKAYDEAENLSDFSDVITGSVFMPKITMVTPADGSSLGGKTQDIKVVFDKVGNGRGNKVALGWRKAGDDDYEPLTSEPIPAESYSGNRQCVNYAWNIKGLDGSYDLRAVLYDADDNTDTYEVSYTVSTSGPKAPAELEAVSENGVIDLTWERTTSADCKEYNIYRLAPGEDEYGKLVTVKDRTTVRYVDRTAKAGETYIYRIAGVDSFGTEGEASNTAEVTVTADGSAPSVSKIFSEKPRLNKTARITVSAEDNIGVKTVTLSYKAKDTDDVTVIGTSDCADGKAVFDWDTTGLADGEYSVIASAVDVNGNVSEKTAASEQSFTVDNTGISKISLDKENCTASSIYVTLRWADVSDEDFGYFSVEQKNEDGTFTEVGTSSEMTGLHVQDLSPDTKYTFRVVGYDNIGNRGIPSDEAVLKTVSDNSVPLITAFYPESKAYSKNIDMRVTAEDNAGVSSVKLSYSYDSEDDKTWYPLTEITESKNNDFFYTLNLSDMEEGTVYVQAVASDASGNESSPVINGFIVDKTAPNEISDLTAQTGEGNIHLIWTVTSEDTAKFLIYRSEDELNSYSLIAECETKDYYDTSAKLGVLYSYKVKAVDDAGNKSVYSNEAVAQITEDNIKPVLLGFNYRSGSTVSLTPEIRVVARDNYALSNVIVEYRPKNRADGLWDEIGTFEIQGNYSEAKFTWDTVDLADGTYEFKAYCEDLMGNVSDPFITEFVLDATAPAAPVVTLHKDDYKIGLEWTVSDAESVDHYNVYRLDPQSNEYSFLGRTTSLEYTDFDVIPNTMYKYKVEAHDEAGNHTESKEYEGFAYDNDTLEPVIDIPDSLYGVAGEELVLDGSACTDNVRIKRYTWSSGESTVYGKNTVITFDKAGKYTITLSVEDTSGNIAERDISVTIYDPSKYGFLNISVTDESNRPLKYAYIYVYTGFNQDVHTMLTGYDGTLRICTKVGENKIAVYKDGYLPEERTVSVNRAGDNGNVSFSLKSGELVTGGFNISRMNPEEMAAAGIDFSDPQNYHCVQFTVKLTFKQEPIPTVFRYIYNEELGIMIPYEPNGAGSSTPAKPIQTSHHSTTGGGTGIFSFTPVPLEYGGAIDETQPILAYVYISQEISFMKDIYSVAFGIMNNAEEQFVIENGLASIEILDGLSLVGNDTSVTKSMGPILGQGKDAVSWTVRGDKAGDYDISAEFNGTLMPFKAPVYAKFKTATPLSVDAGDGLVIYVMPEESAYIGEEYFAQLALVNQGSNTYYNLTTDFGYPMDPGYKREVKVTHPDGSVSYERESHDSFMVCGKNDYKKMPVISGGQKVDLKTFEPGDILYGTFRQVFSAEGDPDKVYYKLIDSVVEELTGDTNVKVVIRPIPSHIVKYNVVEILVNDDWADPVDMTTGAFTDKVTALSVEGETPLELNLNYNSLNVPESREHNEFDPFWHSQKGQLGYGWYHDFEAYLDFKDNTIDLHWNPTAFASFIEENRFLGNVTGEVVDGKIVLSDTYDTGEKNYVCINSGMSEYRMSRDENNIYTLEMPSGQKYVFDSEGRLIKMIQANGKSATLTHIGNTTTISEDNSDAKLVLNYSGDGLLTSVSDGNGRMTTLAYENDLLASVTNPLGDKVVYTYDENDRLVSAAVEGSAPYVTNTYDDKGRVIAQDDADPNTPLTYFSYSENEKNEFIVEGTDRNGNTVKYVSDGIGRLTSVTDQNNNTVKYSYDLKGNLIEETTADGSKLVYTYDKDNNLIKIKDASGNETSMTYDERGNLLSVKSPTGEISKSTYNKVNLLLSQINNSSAKKSYSYNKNGQLISEEIEGLGKRTYEYTNGRVTSSTDYENNISYKTYDEYGNLRSETNREGHRTVYKYDLLNRIVSITDDAGTESYTYDAMGNKTSATDSRGNTTYYSYNANNWLVSAKTAKGTVTYSYDNEGRLIRQNNIDGTTVVNTYDAAGNLLTTVNENGEKTSYIYDAANRVISTTLHDGETEYTESYSYYPNGKLKKVTYADGSAENYTYDKLWRLIKTTDNKGNTITSEYDANGNLLKTTDAEGNSISYSYDKYGRLISIADANGNVTTYDEYDLNGNCTKKTLPNGQSIGVSYNKEGMITKISLLADDEGSEDISVFYYYDAAGRMTDYIDEEGNKFHIEYDAVGNVVKAVDAENNAITNKYDEVNNLVLSTNAIDVDTKYTYDSMGSLVKTTNNYNTAREQQTSNTFDKLGRVKTSTDAENGSASYTYDRFGNIVSVTYPNGGVNTYSYDSMGRVTESVNAIGSKKTYTYNDIGELASQLNARGQKTTYEYYKNGWIKSFTDDLGTVYYTYDGNGNVLTVADENGIIVREYDCMNHVTKYTDFRGNTIKYSYDQLGNLVAITYPGGRIVRYSYYKNGMLKSVTDWDNRVTLYSYDGNGRLVKTVRPEGSVEERTYDAVGRLVTISDTNGEEVINQTVYSYDESGNVTSITTSNSTSMNGLTSAEMKYNAANQLIEYNGNEVKYDADGNMIYGPLNGKMTAFAYDCRNRLISAGGISYEYDAENNRIAQTENGSKTSYVVDSDSFSLTRILMMTKEGDTTYFVYGDGLISQECGEEYLTYHFDNLGNTKAITDKTGKIADTFDYGPYGELLSENEHGIIFLYTGQWGVATDSNGLYYLRARYYNIDIKRFINQDVLTGSITDSPTLNRYSYVNGNPVSLSDPFGLSPSLDWRKFGHTALDLLGFWPGIGFVFDAINAVWYWAEGNYFAALESAFSALPGAGDAFGALSKGSKACKIMTGFHKAGSGGKLLLNLYSLGSTAKKYLDGSASFSLDEISADVFNTIFTGISMYGSAIDYGTKRCFVAGTPVLTAEGSKPIEEIQIGDEVYSEDEITGEVAVKKVTQTFVNETKELIHIHVNGETISATPSHPFYVNKFGWTTARALRAGDVLVLSNGEYVIVEWVQHEILEAPVKVYNFEVEDFHTYFVGVNHVLVHNICEKYRDLKKKLKQSGGDDQAHHVGQNAAFKDVIPKKDGLSIPLEGNIFKDKNSPHYKAHKSLEEFWDEYREGGTRFGTKPTIGQYNRAAYDSLVKAGKSKEEATNIIYELFEQQKEYKLSTDMLVPRIPGKIKGL